MIQEQYAEWNTINEGRVTRKKGGYQKGPSHVCFLVNYQEPGLFSESRSHNLIYIFLILKLKKILNEIKTRKPY